MGELRLESCCRLCLKEEFSLTNIFSHRSTTGDPLYKILNFIYDIKIFEDDGLPSQICSPCMWRMIEFDACKRNVRSAEAEIIKVISQRTPHSNKVSDDGGVFISEGTQLDGVSEEIGGDHSPNHSEIRIKEEIDILEWEMPIDTVIKEQDQEENHQSDNGGNCDYDSAEVEPVEVPEEEYEKRNKGIFCLPLSEFHGASVVDTWHSLKESSSIECTLPMDGRIHPGRSKRGAKNDGIATLKSASTGKTRKKSLKSRSKVRVGNGLVSYLCDICKKSFRSKGVLAEHVRIHYEERLFSCKVCGKKFKQKQVTNIHELSHLRDALRSAQEEKKTIRKPFACKICGKKFRLRHYVSVHANVHSNRFSCTICKKGFRSQSHLKIHQRIHSNEKPYQCKLCLKCFSMKGNMDTHMVTHQTERPFNCSVCQKTFKLRQTRDSHELVHVRNEITL